LTVVVVDRAGNSSAPRNPVTLTLEFDRTTAEGGAVSALSQFALISSAGAFTH
jgi:hypothetical protein